MASNPVYVLLLAAILFIVLMTIAVILTYFALKYLADYNATLKKLSRR